LTIIELVSDILTPTASTDIAVKVEAVPPGDVAHVPRTIDPCASASPVCDKSVVRDDTAQLTEALIPGAHDEPNDGSVTNQLRGGVGTSRIEKVPAGERVTRAGH